MANWTDEEMNGRIEELNLRPRMRLNWRTPYEVHYGVRLLLGLANSPILTPRLALINSVNICILLQTQLFFCQILSLYNG